jgi:phospholipid transport system substrate-binding protein
VAKTLRRVIKRLKISNRGIVMLSVVKVRFFLVLLALSLLAVPTLAAAQNQPVSADVDDPAYRAAAEKFIDDLVRDAIRDLADAKVPEEKRFSAFERIYTNSFDIERISRFALARYWNIATPAERQEFLALFKESSMQMYRSRLKSYRGQSMRVTGSRLDGSGQHVLVSAEIIDPASSNPVAIEWRVVRTGNTLRVGDIAVEGISLGLTLRSEYAAVIEKNGGRVAGLLNELRVKNAASNAPTIETKAN